MYGGEIFLWIVIIHKLISLCQSTNLYLKLSTKLHLLDVTLWIKEIIKFKVLLIENKFSRRYGVGDNMD